MVIIPELRVQQWNKLKEETVPFMIVMIVQGLGLNFLGLHIALHF